MSDDGQVDVSGTARSLAWFADMAAGGDQASSRALAETLRGGTATRAGHYDWEGR